MKTMITLMTMQHMISRYLKNKSGATAIEYGLIAALIAVLIIPGVTIIGQRLGLTFTSVANSLGGPITP